MPDRRLPTTLAILAVISIAAALRTGPLHVSALPFNPDGIIHAHHASVTLKTGSLPLSTLATDDLLFTAYLATLADIVGIPPLLVAQPSMIVVATVPCLLIITYARRIGFDLGWTPSNATYAGLLAGGLLAVDGLYLHRSMPTDEQTAGLLFVPVAAVAVVRATILQSRRWTLIALLSLLALPATHNLDALIIALALTALVPLLVAIDHHVDVRQSTGFAIAGWLLLAGYTLGIAWLTPAQIIQSGRLTAAPGVFIAWILLVLICLAWVPTWSAVQQRVLGVSVLAFMFGLLAVNALTPVFPGTQQTPPELVLGILPLVGIAMLGAWIVPDALDSPTGIALIALLTGSLTLIGFSLTVRLTPEYLSTAYRTQTFMHLPVMGLVGVGATAVLARRPTLRNRQVLAVATAVLLVAAAASIPIAFGGLSLLSYKGVTTPAEYSASQFGANHLPGTWVADNHLARITWPLEDPETQADVRVTTHPVAAWTTPGGAPPVCPTIVQQSWTTVGAQLFPRPPATVPSTEFDRFITQNHRVYAAGTSDPIWLSIPANEPTGSCMA